MHGMNIDGMTGRRVAMAAGLACVSVGLGCTNRVLTIERAEYINTRPQSQGEPLEVDVVTVVPEDFEGDHAEINERLKPGGGITSKEWFANRPTKESYVAEADTRFKIPKERILSFTATTDKSAIWGKRVGPPVQGTKIDKRAIVVKEVPAPSDLWAEDAAIYVFCRFKAVDGTDLPSPPAVFHKVGNYRREISVKIDKEDVAVTSQRHGGSDQAADAEEEEKPEEGDE